MNLAKQLLQRCEALGERPAIILASGEQLRFQDFAAMALEQAAHLERCAGQPLSRVGLCAPVSPRLFASVVATWAVGAVPVFPEASRGLRTVLSTLQHADVQALVMPWQLSPLRLLAPGLLKIPRVGLSGRCGQTTPEYPSRSAGEPAMISYSSGTTGKPKAIVRTHRVLVAQARAVGEALQAAEDDVLLTTMPGFVLAALANGQTSIMAPRDAVTPEFLLRHGVTRLLGAPAFFRQLLAHPDPQPVPIARIDVGGALVPWTLVEAMAARFPDANIVSVYGATEAEPIACQAYGESTQEQREAFGEGLGLLCGHPVAGIDHELRPLDGLNDGGELVVRGAAVIGNDDGHATGDLVRVDDSGRLWMLGRRSAAWAGPTGVIAPLALEGPALTTPGIDNAVLAGEHGVLVVEAAQNGAIETLAKRLAGQSELKGLRILAHRVPLEKRHRSKPDFAALKEILKRKLAHAVTI